MPVGVGLKADIVLSFQEDLYLGGRFSHRPSTARRAHFKNAAGIVFVIDSHKSEAEHFFEENLDEMVRALAEDDLQGLPVLLLATQFQNCPEHEFFSADELADRFGFGTSIFRERLAKVLTCNMHSGLGFTEGMQWMKAAVSGDILEVPESGDSVEQENDEKSSSFRLGISELNPFSKYFVKMSSPVPTSLEVANKPITKMALPA